MDEIAKELASAIIHHNGGELPDHIMHTKYPLIIIDSQGRTWAARYYGGVYYACQDDVFPDCHIESHMKGMYNDQRQLMEDATARAMIDKIINFHPWRNEHQPDEVVDVRRIGVVNGGCQQQAEGRTI